MKSRPVAWGNRRPLGDPVQLLSRLSDVTSQIPRLSMIGGYARLTLHGSIAPSVIRPGHWLVEPMGLA